ncbi:MAG: hypothetical protein H6974_15705 [Gammaproteobacteria bacterium]|nr:hypothetical protein [Candidatus Competibacteraceae bacterium]MCP5198201.1 hypothetical protein [Gammaproteobacteria bacterium]
MTKWRAFTIYLTASILILLAFLWVMLFVWYPAPYFEIDGGWKVWGLLAGVNMVLGPLLTLIVFKPGKRGLWFDMTCIILVQLAALIYGGTIIYQQRPAFVVFGVDRFTSVPATDVDFDQLKYPELKRIAAIGPMLAEAKLPEDLKLRQELLFAVLSEGQKDLEFRPELYHPYQPNLQQLRKHSIDLPQIAALNTDAKHAIDAFLASQGGQMEDYLYLPLKGRNTDIVMVLSPENGLPVGSISINPWLEDYQKSER